MSVIRVEVRDKIQKEAAIVLAEMGLTTSDAINMFLTHIAREKEAPFLNTLIKNEK